MLYHTTCMANRYHYPMWDVGSIGVPTYGRGWKNGRCVIVVRDLVPAILHVFVAPILGQCIWQLWGSVQ